MNQDYDVVIVGAGPAGTACALALGNSGLKVALVDKSKFPRNKTCGDAIPGPALRIVEKFLNNSKKEFEKLELKQQIRSSSIHTQKGRPIQINWKTKAYNSPRTSFDNFLLDLVKESTNTDIYEGIVIDQIIKEDKISLIGRSKNLLLRCDLVVGCDGANSIVSRAFDEISFSKSRSCLAVRAYYENVDSPEDSNEFYLLKDSPGYFWIFPLGNGNYNVGLGFTTNHIAQSKLNIKKTLIENIEHNPILNRKFKNAKIKSKIEGFKLPIGGQKVKISGERFLLAGDAAYLIDPLQGHGIDKAMQSGLLAAQQIQKCFKHKNFSAQFISEYDSIVNKVIGKELRRNFHLMKLLHRIPWLIEGLAIMTSNRKIRDLLQKIFM